MSEAVLYHYWRSSSSYRVRIALNLLDIAYEARPVDLLNGEQLSSDALARNPQGLVPVLAIDGQYITQSLAIIEYLNDTRGGPLLPADGLGKAKARALAMAIAMDLQPICNLRVARRVKAMSEGRIKTADWMRTNIKSGLLEFEQMVNSIGDTRYCYGDAVSLPDLVLVPQLYNAETWQVDLSDLPRSMAIARRLNALVAFQQAHPDRSKPEPAASV